MTRPLLLLLCCLTAGCATPPPPPPQAAASPCAVHEASYACQVERYHNVSQ